MPTTLSTWTSSPGSEPSYPPDCDVGNTNTPPSRPTRSYPLESPDEPVPAGAGGLPDELGGEDGEAGDVGEDVDVGDGLGEPLGGGLVVMVAIVKLWGADVEP